MSLTELVDNAYTDKNTVHSYLELLMISFVYIIVIFINKYS